MRLNRLRRELQGLRRTLWALLGVVILAIGLSMLLNVLHAPHNLVAQGVGAVPPLAFFTVVEVMARVRVSNPWLTAVRVLGSLVVGGIAAYESYRQQMYYIETIGYAPTEAHWWPAIIDGSMAVFTVSLIEVHRLVKLKREEIAQIAEEAEEQERASVAEALERESERAREREQERQAQAERQRHRPGPKPRKGVEQVKPRQGPPRRKALSGYPGAPSTPPARELDAARVTTVALPPTVDVTHEPAGLFIEPVPAEAL